MKALRIFVSSPGDVEAERALALQVIEQLQLEFSGRILLTAVLWEREPLTATLGPQEQLVSPADTDVVITILWSRLGTPLGSKFLRADGSTYASGTEYEFELAMQGAREHGKPTLLVYRKTREIKDIKRSELREANAQWEAVDRFFLKWFRAGDNSIAGAVTHFESAERFASSMQTHLREIVRRAVEGREGMAQATRQWAHGSPFRGLQAFEYEQAEVFFGRTRETGEIVSALCAKADEGCAFVVVLGPSGSGKSSLVKAGVAPHLIRRRRVNGVRRWIRCTFRPAESSGDLFDGFAAKLVAAGLQPEQSGLTEAELAESFRTSAQAGTIVLNQWAIGAGSHLLLIVDQLEELFTRKDATAAQVQLFFSLLEALARSGHIWIIATLRSDFYAAAAADAAFLRLKQAGGQYDLRAPDADDIRRIIELPAAAAGLSYQESEEHALADVLRDATVGDVAALPLLEFTLDELYKRRTSDGLLTLAAYREIGGLEGSISHIAAETFGSLGAESQARLSFILHGLVTVDPSRPAARVRKRLPMAKLDADAPARDLVKAFVDARLFVADSDAEGRVTVDVAHEALLTRWDQVDTWFNENHDFIRIKARIAEAARLWHEEGHPPGRLSVEGGPYNDVRKLLDTPNTDLQEIETAFVAESQARFSARARRRNALAALLASLAVVAVVFGVFALMYANRARLEARTAERATEFMVGLFEQADPEQTYEGAVPARNLLDIGVNRARAELTREPLILWRLLQAMGRSYLGLGDSEKSIELLAQADAMTKQARPAEAEQLRLGLALGDAYFYAEDYERAGKYLDEARGRAAQLHGKPHKDTSAVLVSAGDLEVWQPAGDSNQATAFYRQALDIDTSLNDLLGIARDHNRMGFVAFNAGDFDAASRHFDAAVRNTAAAVGNEHLLVARYENDRAGALFELGKFAEAEASYRKAVQAFIAVFGEAHPDVAVAQNNLARVLIERSEFAEAKPFLERAKATQESLAGILGEASLAITLNNLGLVSLFTAEPAAAAELFLRASELAAANRQAIGVQAMTNLAETYLVTGDIKGAAEKLSQAATLYGPADDSWRYALLLSAQGELLTRQGRLQEAQQALETSAAILDVRWKDQNPFKTAVHRRLANVK